MEKIVRAELQLDEYELLDEELLNTVTTIRAAGDAVGVSFTTYQVNIKSITTGSGLVKVDKGNLRLLSDIRHLPNLSELTIPFQSIADISRLASTRIKKLDLSENMIADLSPISSMDHLEELKMESIVTDSFLPVIYAKSLKTLIIMGAFGQERFDELCEVGSETLKDFSFIRAMVKTITNIGNFPNLEFINLFGCPIPDLSPLGALKSLKRVSLNNDVCTDFSFLKELPVLEHMVISAKQKDCVLELYGEEPPFKIIAF